MPDFDLDEWEDDSDVEEFEWASEVPYDLSFDLDDHGLWVHWNPPTVVEGRIKGYQVEFTNLDTGAVHFEPSQESPALVMNLFVKDCSEASVRVRAFTMEKQLDFSEAVHVHLNHNPEPGVH